MTFERKLDWIMVATGALALICISVGTTGMIFVAQLPPLALVKGEWACTRSHQENRVSFALKVRREYAETVCDAWERK